MFDIGFWELSIIGVVALIVIGPERLPGVARTAGFWFGRARRFVSTVKADIDREIKAEELQKVIKAQTDSAGIHEIFEETKEAVESAGKDTKEAVESLESETEYLVRSDRFEQSDDAFDDFDDDDDDEPVASAKGSEDKPQNDSEEPLETAGNSEKKPQDDDNKA